MMMMLIKKNNSDMKVTNDICHMNNIILCKSKFPNNLIDKIL